MKLITIVTSILFATALNASPLTKDNCWTSFEKAPAGLVSLCKYSAKTSSASLENEKVFFFAAKFEDREEFYTVVDVLPVGGKCFWAQGFKMMSMDTQ